MSDELKPCPLCGSKIVRMNGSYSDTCFCINVSCPLSNPMKVDKCQTRPIEDELQKKLEIAVNAIKLGREYDVTRQLNQIMDNALAEIESVK